MFTLEFCVILWYGKKDRSNENQLKSKHEQWKDDVRGIW